MEQKEKLSSEFLLLSVDVYIFFFLSPTKSDLKLCLDMMLSSKLFPKKKMNKKNQLVSTIYSGIQYQYMPLVDRIFSHKDDTWPQ
jgi:hypothetical protein